MTQCGAGASATSSKGSSISSNSTPMAPDGTGSPALRVGWDAAIQMPPDHLDQEQCGQSVEDAVDALEDGDRTIRGGTARAALRHDVFRRVFIGAFLSNIGSWMQNVVLGALA